LTVVMLIVVTFVSSLVHLYSISYMSEDPTQFNLTIVTKTLAMAMTFV